MENHLLRHFLATLAYRANVAVDNVPADYAEFEAGNGVKKTIEILNHMSNLIANVIRCYRETEDTALTEEPWEREVQRFFANLQQLDDLFATGASPQRLTVDQILQGPLCDAMTHVGQLLTLRRLAGTPAEGGHYMRANIEAGKFVRGLPSPDA